MIKWLLKAIGQRLLGFDNYLFLFSRIKAFRLRYMHHDREFHHFLRLIPPAGIVLDIGANLGFTVATVARYRPDCRLMAFEPVPANVRTLKRIIVWYKLNNVTVFPVALGNQQGITEMIMPARGPVKLQGLSHVVEHPEEMPAGKRFNVAMETLDAYQHLFVDEKVTAIKMDAENYEYFILLGGEATIRQHQPVIYAEMWDNNRRLQCFELLRNWGYEIRVFRNGKLVPFSGQSSVNFFFLPAEKT